MSDSFRAERDSPQHDDLPQCLLVTRPQLARSAGVVPALANVSLQSCQSDPPLYQGPSPLPLPSPTAYSLKSAPIPHYSHTVEPSMFQAISSLALPRYLPSVLVHNKLLAVYRRTYHGVAARYSSLPLPRPYPYLPNALPTAPQTVPPRRPSHPIPYPTYLPSTPLLPCPHTTVRPYR
nr:uncharacterized protein LOC113817327 [Penaeus vannamei]